ncbi:MAG: methylated-DNA--[protein]-cysteine S-methyltransferase [Candidatus Eisenbacteria bacterium]|nr:methylated-DNA--[protein]-cysteine S-methyltransferase [Candidatus Eisenbacteria bacterium]
MGSEERVVGRALATNPFPVVVPCHRAIRSDGGLGGYQGGVAMKRALLEFVGVAVSSAGRVVAPRQYYGTGARAWAARAADARGFRPRHAEGRTT